MQLIYVGPREEIVIHNVGVVKKGVAFECPPSLAAALIARFNLPSADALFIEKPQVKVEEKIPPKVGRKPIN